MQSLYEELGWELLSDRRICRRVLQIHKLVDGKVPEYLQHCLPPNRNVIINLPLIFQKFRSRTDRYSGSLFPHDMSLWNNFIADFQNLPNFLCLKAYMVPLFRPTPKPIYGKRRHIFLDTQSLQNGY